MQLTINQKTQQWGERIPVINRKCRVCTEGFEYKRNEYAGQPDNNACWNCQFWLEKWEIKDEPTTVRVNDNHYIISTQGTKGMGGAKVRIVFNDGRVVETDNLWHQGQIPKLWQSFGMENNAKFGELINDNC